MRTPNTLLVFIVFMTIILGFVLVISSIRTREQVAMPNNIAMESTNRFVFVGSPPNTSVDVYKFEHRFSPALAQTCYLAIAPNGIALDCLP